MPEEKKVVCPECDKEVQLTKEGICPECGLDVAWVQEKVRRDKAVEKVKQAAEKGKKKSSGWGF